MGKLSEKQKKNIVASYIAGGVTYSMLARKYGVGIDTIRRAVKADPEFAKKCEELKKEEEAQTAQSMAEFFAAGRKNAQSLITRLLNIPDELIESSTLRERVGAAHYIKEMYADNDDGVDGTPVTVNISFEDTSVEGTDESL